MSQATASVNDCAVPEVSVYVPLAVTATFLGAVRIRGSVVTTS